MTTLGSFAHRRNGDASIDSICKTCYQTVASAYSESELVRVEESHTCDQNSEFTRAAINSRRSTSARAALGGPW
jgi:hypothetical protein